MNMQQNVYFRFASSMIEKFTNMTPIVKLFVSFVSIIETSQIPRICSTEDPALGNPSPPGETLREIIAKASCQSDLRAEKNVGSNLQYFNSNVNVVVFTFHINIQKLTFILIILDTILYKIKSHH
jgi:hypothetical protein